MSIVVPCPPEFWPHPQSEISAIEDDGRLLTPIGSFRYAAAFDLWGATDGRAVGRFAGGRLQLRHFGNQNGRWGVTTYGHVSRRIYVHTIIAHAFHGSPPTPGLLVRHLNDLWFDNRASNLAWGTPRENTRDAVSNRRFPRAVVSYRFDAKQIATIRRRASARATLTEIATAVGASPNTLKYWLKVHASEHAIDVGSIRIGKGGGTARRFTPARGVHPRLFE